MQSADEFHLPKGPRGKWRSTLKIIRNPRQAFLQWVKQYGDPFLVTALNGPLVMTGRPDLIKQVYAEDPETYAPFAVQTIRPLIGAGSMLMLEGEQHKRERRLVMPMFHGDRMRAYGESMQRIALDELDKVRHSGVFAMLDVATQISLGVIAKAVFGGDSQSEMTELMRLGKKLVQRSSPLIFFSKRMHFPLAGWSPMDRFLAARKELTDAFDREISRRAPNANTNPNEPSNHQSLSSHEEQHHEEQHREKQHREDILSLLAFSKYEDGTPITRENIHAELITFLFAGHETSALEIAWAFYHLHRNPDKLQKLREELSAADPNQPSNYPQLPYLKAVVQETLRLNPVVTETLRLLKRPMSLGEYRLPAGMGIAPATVLAHYNPETYSEPELFRPERFLEKSYGPSEYMPFGGGHRRCIGAAFASYEIAIVLGTLLKNFEFELLEPRAVVPVRRNVTLGPSTGIRLRVLRST